MILCQGSLLTVRSDDSIPRFNGQRVMPEYFVGNQTPGVEGSEDYLVIHQQVMQSQQPNYVGCKMRVPSGFNVSVWRSRLLEGNYKDMVVCELLDYGFPIGFDSVRLPEHTSKNHGGALGYAEHVDEFLRKEQQFGAIFGPFCKNPLDSFLTTSPLNTVE